MTAAHSHEDVLRQIHQFLRPRTYLEIGVQHGHSWRLASAQSMSIGVDPKPQILFPIEGLPHLFTGTSDDFFRTQDVRSIFQGLGVDLAFVDGMPSFEHALRDILHAEMVSSERSVIVLRDCLPPIGQSEDPTLSDVAQGADAWKTIICLTQERPDLEIQVIDMGGTSLAFIQNLDPDNQILSTRYKEIAAQYSHLSPSMLAREEAMKACFHVVPYSPKAVEALCSPRHRFRSLSPRFGQKAEREGRRASP